MANRNVTVTIETLAKLGGTRVLKGSYADLARQVQANVASMQSAHTRLDSYIQRNVKSYVKLGEQAKAAETKVGNLAKKVQTARADPGTSEAKLAQLVKQYENAAKAAEKIRDRQRNLVTVISESKAEYDRVGQAIDRAKSQAEKFFSATNRGALVARATFGALTREVGSFARQLGASARQNFTPRVNLGGLLGGVRTAASSITGLLAGADREFSNAGRGLTVRAVAIGTALGLALTGAFRGATNLTIGLGRQAFDTTAEFERRQLSLQELARQEIIEQNTRTRTVVIGSRLITAEQQLAAARDTSAKGLKKAAADLEAYENAVVSAGNAEAAIATARANLNNFAPQKGEAPDEVAARRLRYEAALAAALERKGDAEGVVTGYQAKQVSLGDFQDKRVNITKQVTEQLISNTEAQQRAVVAARELVKWEQKLAVQSPFSEEDIDAILKFGRNMGFTTTESKRNTQALVDFAAATGLSNDKLRDLGVALGQVKGAGKLQGQEVLQFVNAGLPIYGILSKATGKSVAELKKLQEAGKLTADIVIPAVLSSLEENFGGAAGRLSETFSGLVSSIGDLKNLKLREVFGPAFEAIKPGLKELVRLLTNTDFTQFGERIAAFIGPLVTGIVNARGYFSEFLGDIKRMDAIEALALLFSKLMPPEQINNLRTVFGVLRNVRTVAGQVIARFRDFGLVGGLKLNLEQILPPDAANFANRIIDTIAALPGRVTTTLGEIKGAFERGGIKSLGEYLGFSPQLATDIERIVQSLGTIGTAILRFDSAGFGAGLTTLGGNIYLAIRNSGIGTSILNGFRDLVGGLTLNLPGLISSLVLPSGQEASPAENEIKRILGDIVKVIAETALRLVSALVGSISILAVAGVRELSKGIIDLETGAKKAVVDFFAAVLNQYLESARQINRIAGVQVIPVPDVQGGAAALKAVLDAEGKAKKDAIDGAFNTEINALKTRAAERDKAIREAFFGPTGQVQAPAPVNTVAELGGNLTGSALVTQLTQQGDQIKAQSTSLATTVGTQTAQVQADVSTTRQVVTTDWSTMTDQMVKDADAAMTGINTKLEEGGKAFAATAKRIVANLKNIFITDAQWVDIGANLVKGIIQGIDNMETPLYQRIISLITGAVTVAREAGGIKSPSRPMNYRVGVPLGQGVIVGIESQISAAAEAARRLVTAAVDAAIAAQGRAIALDLAPADGGGRVIPGAVFGGAIGGSDGMRIATENAISGGGLGGGGSVTNIAVSVPVNTVTDAFERQQLAWQVADEIAARLRK